MKRLWLSLSLVASCTSFSLSGYQDPLPGYGAATVDERAQIMSVVEDYYLVRTQAIAAGDAAVLYVRYPLLATAEDRARGVNTDAWFIERMKAIRVKTVRVQIEAAEPMRVFVKNDAAVAYVHGRDDWIESGTASELYTRIDLRRMEGRWTIERTDEVMQSEWPPPPTPRG